MVHITSFTEHARIDELTEQLSHTGASYEQQVSFTCFLYGEHYAYLSQRDYANNPVPAFSPDWYRFAKPCWMARNRY